MDKDLVSQRRLPGQPGSSERPSSTLTGREFTKVKQLSIAAQKFLCITKLKPPNTQMMVGNIINQYYYQTRLKSKVFSLKRLQKIFVQANFGSEKKFRKKFWVRKNFGLKMGP